MFDQFNRNVHTELKAVLKDAVREIAREAKKNAPHKSGEYRKSIGWSISRSGLIAWAHASRSRDKKDRHKVSYIGHLLEYGTVKMKARPHFGPAVARVKALFGGRLEAAISRVRGTRG